MKCIKHVGFINLSFLRLGQRYIHWSKAQQALSPEHCYSQVTQALQPLLKWASAKAVSVWQTPDSNSKNGSIHSTPAALKVYYHSKGITVFVMKNTEWSRNCETPEGWPVGMTGLILFCMRYLHLSKDELFQSSSRWKREEAIPQGSLLCSLSWWGR